MQVGWSREGRGKKGSGKKVAVKEKSMEECRGDDEVREQIVIEYLNKVLGLFC